MWHVRCALCHRVWRWCPRQLLALDCKRPGRAERMFPAVPGWSDITNPMAARVWEAALASHPDIEYCSYLVQGLWDGFRIGFGYGSFKCTSAGSNMQSAEVRPNVITDFLSAELRARRVLGPVDPDIAKAIQVNRFGLVPNLTSGGSSWTSPTQQKGV